MNAIIVIAIFGIISLFIGVFKAKKLALPLSISGCVIALGLIGFQLLGDYETLMQGMLVFDKYSIAFMVIMISITIAVFVISNYYYRSNIEHLSDIYALFLFSLVGCIVLVSFNNFVTLFVGLEIMSIPLYILAASNRKNLASNEAGLKYYLTGSFASAFLLLGITLVYGVSGSFNVNAIAQYIAANRGAIPPLFICGSLLILATFIFKVAAAPFHMWAPDVYQGSPTVITSYMATVIKTAAFGAMLKLVILMIPSDPYLWKSILSTVAILTMITGNIIALQQTNLKRLLAYSGIANAGYVMIAIATVSPNSYQYILYYMVGYSVASILAFAIYVAVKDKNQIDDIAGLKGLSKNNKLLTITFTVSMLSLASIPPFAGFFGKYAIFKNAIDSKNYWLVVIAVINAVIGVGYYLRAMIACFTPSDTLGKVPLSLLYRFILIGGILILLAAGIFPSLILNRL